MKSTITLSLFILALLGALTLWPPVTAPPLQAAATDPAAAPREQQLTHVGDREHEIVSLWSPWNRDGKQLLYTILKSNPEIWAYDFDRRESKKLTEGLRLAGFPVFDFALKRITFFGAESGNLDVWTVDTQTKERKRLTTDPAPDVHPTWSPDGKKIAFASTRSKEAAIWIMDADGSNPKQVTTHGSGDWIPSWSPDGTKIAYSRGAQDKRMTVPKMFEVIEPPGGHLWIVDLQTGTMRQLTDEKSATDWNPMWSPDGTRITFASRRTGNPDIWAINADGSNLAQLTNNPAYDFAPTWGPDGTKIAFTSNRTGAYEVWLLDLQKPINEGASP